MCAKDVSGLITDNRVMVMIINSENTHDFWVSGLTNNRVLTLVAVFCPQSFILPGERKANIDIFVFQYVFFEVVSVKAR